VVEPHAVIHTAVARHAAEQPDAVALIGKGARITYRQLDAASDTYAARLAEAGIGPGETVPLLLRRSARLAALELAVLKCGAAYANLDPAWPAERARSIAARIAPKVVVADDERLSSQFITMRLELDLAEAAARAADFTVPLVSATEPATVFFTSGTTGGPKGVIVPHRAVTRMFAGPDRLHGFGPGHAIPLVAALAWDMYAFELWGQLVAGGTGVYADAEPLMPSALRDLVATAGVDTLWVTATLFNLFVDEDVDCFRGLGRVFVGGEKLSSAHALGFVRHHPSIPLWNGYGPAENCMFTTTWRISEQDCHLPEGIPVGVAVPGTTVLIMDEQGSLCRPGETGEILAAGCGLALGYLHQPELTAQSFPTIDVDDTPTRVYRTGDLGLLDASGVLRFRGRRDRQVKISGHRIEFAEIEIAARGVPGVRECVVIPLSAADGSVTGMALFFATHAAAAEDPDLDEAGLRAELVRLLPSYLVPRIIRRLDRFPMTANGKVDQAKLQRLAIRPRRGQR
jgi:D-alanine--poly(phosphoribitol) ligase subunit 1